MPIIKVKPLSVNQCWQGRRFKTRAYKSYASMVRLLLPPLTVPNGRLRLDIVFGVSTKAADIDNPLKPFIDIIQARYLFNDKRVYEMLVKKDIVKKGNEYIKFDISALQR